MEERFEEVRQTKDFSAITSGRRKSREVVPMLDTVIERIPEKGWILEGRAKRIVAASLKNCFDAWTCKNRRSVPHVRGR